MKSKTPSFLETLSYKRRKAEQDLNFATKEFDAFIKTGENNSSRLSELRNAERQASQTWNNIFTAILSYRPKSLYEIGLKISIIAQLIEEGYEDPIILETLHAIAQELMENAEILSVAKSAGLSDKTRILIIDDDIIDRISIKRALLARNNDLELIELGNGIKAIQTIKDHKPVVTLLDLSMPAPNGFEVLELIRNDPELEKHPVWILSGSTNPSDREKAESVGADEYYVKPSTHENYDALAKVITRSLH
jgi:CheY-like chemotaxis protein